MPEDEILKGIIGVITKGCSERSRRNFEERLEKEHIATRMQIAKQDRLQREKLAKFETQKQLKLALFQSEMQWKMAMFDAAEKKDLAEFNAEMQKDLAKFNAENQMNLSLHVAEHKYRLEYFPLYIRKWSSRELIQNIEFLPVKVVVIPPDDSHNWNACFTACITQFLQRNIPDNYYEFLGGAWRYGKCTGQAAYTLIYEEFYDEPFLIVDCDLINDYYLSVRICFWHPDSVKCETRQLINNWDMRNVLSFPQDCIDREIYIGEHFQECMSFCASLCALVIGTSVDIYQLSTEISKHSEILSRIPQILTEFLQPLMREQYPDLIQWIFRWYKILVEDVSLDVGVQIRCICELVSAMTNLKKKKYHMEVKGYMEMAWNLWCRHMGLKANELSGILQSPSDLETLSYILLEDTMVMEELEEIYKLYYKLHIDNADIVCLKKNIDMIKESSYEARMLALDVYPIEKKRFENIRQWYRENISILVGWDIQGSFFAVKKDGSIELENAGILQNWQDVMMIVQGNKFVVDLNSSEAGETNHVRYGDWMVGLKRDGTIITMGGNGQEKNIFNEYGVEDWEGIIAIASGGDRLILLKRDGTVETVGGNDVWNREIDKWSDIVSVTMSLDKSMFFKTSKYNYTVGLKKNGTIVVTKNDFIKQSDVGIWSDIVSVSCGKKHIVGLKRDGSTLAAGANDYSQCNVKEWSDIISVACGKEHTIGLKKDGSVMAIGNNNFNQCNVEDWCDIVSVVTDDTFTVGLKKDGRVVAVGDNKYGQCNVGDWKNIIAITIKNSKTIGLTAQGSIVHTEYTVKSINRFEESGFLGKTGLFTKQVIDTTFTKWIDLHLFENNISEEQSVY